MNTLTLYVQVGCSKSVKAGELLQQVGHVFKEIDMTAQPPRPEALLALAEKAQVPISELFRPDAPAPHMHTDTEQATWLSEHPEYIQRPILESSESAIIARPPERVLTFTKSVV